MVPMCLEMHHIAGQHQCTGLRQLDQQRLMAGRVSRRGEDRHVSFCQRGTLRLLAVITQGAVIHKILRPLKLSADPPPIAPARTRQTPCDWVASVRDDVRGFVGNVRAVAVGADLRACAHPTQGAPLRLLRLPPARRGGRREALGPSHPRRKRAFGLPIHLGTMFKRWYPDIEVGELAEAASSPASPCSRTFPTFVSATRGTLSAACFAPSATTAAGASAYRPASAARSLRDCPGPRLKTAGVPHRQGACARRRRCGQIRRARPALRRQWPRRGSGGNGAHS